MEYLRVEFPRSRLVKVDGVYIGRTGEVLELEPGTHIISLHHPYNFNPEQKRIVLNNTNPITPRVIKFKLIDES